MAILSTDEGGLDYFHPSNINFEEFEADGGAGSIWATHFISERQAAAVNLGARGVSAYDQEIPTYVYTAFVEALLHQTDLSGMYKLNCIKIF